MALYSPQGNSLGAFANKFVPVSQVYSTTGKQVSPLSSPSAALANFLNQLTLTQGLIQIFFIHSLSIKEAWWGDQPRQVARSARPGSLPRAAVTFFHGNVSRWGNPPNLVLYRVISNSRQIQLWRRICIIQSDNGKPQHLKAAAIESRRTLIAKIRRLPAIFCVRV